LKSQLEHDCGVIDEVDMVEHANTATYLAVLDGSGDLHTAVADMAVLSQIRPPPVEAIRAAKLLVIDANPPIAALQEAALVAVEYEVKVVFDPTSVSKARSVAHDKKLLSCISYAFPNVDELVAMLDVLSEDVQSEGSDIQSSSFLVDKLRTIRTLAPTLLSRMHPDEAHLIITMGQEGVFLASKTDEEQFSFHHFPSKEGVDVLNATGAGDSLCGAFCYGILEGKTVAESVAFGIEAAVMSLQCEDRAISPNLSSLLKMV
jgi:pseudouridine kinase